VEAGQVWFREDGRCLDDFEAELLTFTGKGDAHDDFVDLLSYAVDEWRSGLVDSRNERVESFGGGFGRRPLTDGFRRDWQMSAGALRGGFRRSY
jgi:hypothetical protein